MRAQEILNGRKDGTLTPVQKADLQLSYLQTNGGALPEATAQQFVRIVQEKSTLLQQAHVQALKSPQERVDTMRFDSRVLNRGHESTPLPEGQRSRPTITKATFNVKKLKAEIRLSDEVVEDNIENGNFKNTVLMAFVARIVTDVEDLVINGDTASPNDYIATWDGMLKSATTNVYNAAGNTFNATVANDTFNTLPNEFKSNRASMRFLMDHNSEQNARFSNSARATNYGDSQLTGADPVNYYGVDLMSMDKWPSNLGIGTNETEVILTTLDNIALGIWKKITIKTDEDIYSGDVAFVADIRADFTYIFEPAVVKATQVLAS